MPAAPPVAPTNSNGIFAGDNPLVSSVNLLIVQLILIIGLSRIIGLVLSPLRQPRVIAEMISGILLGPSALGKVHGFTANIFPPASVGVLGTLANFGLIFFLFLIGLELNPSSLRSASRSAISISIAGIILPFGLGVAVSHVIKENLGDPHVSFGSFTVFMGVAMSITAFPVLARILTERKLLTTQVGQMAMSAAAIDDVVAWVLLALTIALLSASKSPVICVYTFLCGIGFVLAMFLFVRKGIARISQFEQFHLTETAVVLVFVMVLSAAFFTDFIGIHAIFGGFIVGCVMPKDNHFVHAMTEKLEDLVVNLILPSYFAISGIKTEIGFLNNAKSVGLLALVIVVACVGKLLGCGIMAKVAGLPTRKALALAVLMNTKGLVELIVLNIGLQRGVINQKIFTIMVLMALFTTFITSPIVSFIYSPEKDEQAAQPALRGKKKEKFRLMTCLTGMRSVPPMVMLIETVKGRPPDAAVVHCVHLVELSERPSAFMSMQNPRNAKALEDPISLSLESYGRVNRVNITPLLTISSPKDMHEDILRLAARESSNLLVLPFHEHSPSDRLLDFSRINAVAGNVLQNMSCSVGLMIDLGLRRQLPALQVEEIEQENHTAETYNVLVLFFGGADDREALSLGARMCTHQNVHLTVIRFTSSLVEDTYTCDTVIAVTESTERLPLGRSAAQEANIKHDDLLFTALQSERCPFSSRVTVTTHNFSDPLYAALHAANSIQHHVMLVGRAINHPPSCLVSRASERDAATVGPIGTVIIGPDRTAKSLSSSPIVLVIQQAQQQGRQTPETLESLFYRTSSRERGRSPFSSASLSEVVAQADPGVVN